METKQIINGLLDRADRVEDQSAGRIMKQAAARLKELYQEQRWIPVTERLPEELPENKDKKVINCIVAHDTYGNGKLKSQFRQRKYDKHYNRWHWSKIGGITITHWMPLPEPPKEVDHESES